MLHLANFSNYGKKKVISLKWTNGNHYPSSIRMENDMVFLTSNSSTKSQIAFKSQTRGGLITPSMNQKLCASHDTKVESASNCL